MPIAELPAYVREPEPEGIIARGEATGHTHRIVTFEDAEYFEGYNGGYIRVGPNGVSIVHEEHKPVTLEPDTVYEVKRAREYDYLSEITRILRD